jgi:flagellar hook protein FlgE
MIGSMFSGISGLTANSTAMSVIGDNIANVNTVGFKSNRSLFANILSKSLVGSTGQEIGRGVRFWGTTPSWTQGSFENTGSPTDLSINGRGLFVLKDESGADFYTRAGSFTFDEDGNMVNPGNLIVQGFPIDATGNLGAVGNINIPGASTTPPRASTEFTADVNLDAEAAVGETYSVALNVFDSLGADIPLTVEFTKTAAGWDWVATVPDGPVTGGSGSLVFNPDGSLGTNNGGTTDPSLSFMPASGGEQVNLTWDFFDDNTNLTNGDLTNYASGFAYTFQTQDGYSSGSLKGLSTDEEGIIRGTYSNGQQVPIFQLALADFPSYYGLTRLGDTLYQESGASGQPMLQIPGNGTAGIIAPAALEMSNVDLATEFVKMITTQRAFQANSKVITTSDEILGELINIKR